MSNQSRTGTGFLLFATLFALRRRRLIPVALASLFGLAGASGCGSQPGDNNNDSSSDTGQDDDSEIQEDGGEDVGVDVADDTSFTSDAMTDDSDGEPDSPVLSSIECDGCPLVLNGPIPQGVNLTYNGRERAQLSGVVLESEHEGIVLNPGSRDGWFSRGIECSADDLAHQREWRCEGQLPAGAAPLSIAVVTSELDLDCAGTCGSLVVLWSDAEGERRTELEITQHPRGGGAAEASVEPTSFEIPSGAPWVGRFEIRNDTDHIVGVRSVGLSAESAELELLNISGQRDLPYNQLPGTSSHWELRTESYDGTEMAVVVTLEEDGETIVHELAIQAPR